MSTMILSCSSLTDALQAAQDAMHTDYPVTYLDQLYHRDPLEMKQHVQTALSALPPEVDTLLVAMGFCGGSWQDVTAPCRIVLPRIDDCVSLFLTTDDEYEFNRKKAQHIYVIHPNHHTFTPSAILRKLHEEYPDPEMADSVFHLWFDGYHSLDLVETGLYDCYDEAFLTRMQEEADLFDAELGFLPGSNRMLEKLVSGQWDSQFVVVPAGTLIRQGTILD